MTEKKKLVVAVLVGLLLGALLEHLLGPVRFGILFGLFNLACMVPSLAHKPPQFKLASWSAAAVAVCVWMVVVG